MEQDVHKMKTPWVKPENLICEKVDDMDKGPIVTCLIDIVEACHMTCEHFRYVRNILNPTVSHNILRIVENESVEEGVEIDSKRSDKNTGNEKRLSVLTSLHWSSPPLLFSAISVFTLASIGPAGG